jgi:TPR repeat protein
MKNNTKITSLLSFVFICLLSSTAFANDYQLGLYELNRGQFHKALAEFKPLAAEGFSPAQYQLAMMYKNAQGVTKNEKKAFELLTLAANQNDSDAQFDLAVMYTEGNVVKKDLVKAFQLTKKSAKKGLASSQYNLGIMYFSGDGVHQDKHQAARWYKKAADQNYTLAQFNLAIMYYEGTGLEQSNEMSFIWNTIAAYNGYADAAKSRDMDAHNMSKVQVNNAREKADILYQKIIEQKELKAKKDAIKYDY